MKNWADAYKEAQVAGVEKPGPGWLTQNQVCEQLGITRNTAVKILDSLRKSKKVDERHFTVSRSDGRRIKMKHYRLK
jgi:predicted ArsR family transcriptional regulator